VGHTYRADTLTGVMNGDQQQTKAALEHVIHTYKGTTVQYPTNDTFCIIAARESK